MTLAEEHAVIMRHYRRHVGAHKRLRDQPEGTVDEETDSLLVNLPGLVMEETEYEVISCASISMIIEAAIAEKIGEES